MFFLYSFSKHYVLRGGFSAETHLSKDHEEFLELHKELKMVEEKRKKIYSVCNLLARQLGTENVKYPELKDIEPDWTNVLERLCAMWCARNCRPFKVVEDGYLNQFIQVVH